MQKLIFDGEKAAFSAAKCRTENQLTAMNKWETSKQCFFSKDRYVVILILHVRTQQALYSPFFPIILQGKLEWFKKEHCIFGEMFPNLNGYDLRKK